MSEKRWFVVQAYSGQETRAKQLLEERITVNDMQEHFGTVLVPSEEVYKLRGGKKYKSDRKFYPGYVLVQMDMDESAWHLVRRTPKIIGFVGGTSERPAPISDKEADAIMQRMHKSEGVERPRETYETGEMVRVTDGPFSDFNGVVESVNHEKSRLQVAVTIFGRSTPVELGFDQVVKVS